ncbi:MAG: preprotein translocase subunit SecG [Phycisphaerales bacterium JB040]
MILPLAIPYWATGLLVGAFLIVCVIMMLIVLIQRPQGGGLSGAFGAGGGGAGQTAFGTKTGDALTYATIGMFLLYLAFAVGLNFATRPENMGPGSAQPQAVSTDPVETTDSGPLTEEPAPDPTADNPDVDPQDVPLTGDGSGEGTPAESGEGESPATDDAGAPAADGSASEGASGGDAGTDPEPGA